MALLLGAGSSCGGLGRAVRLIDKHQVRAVLEEGSMMAFTLAFRTASAIRRASCILVAIGF
jgi:hypothetical protein